MVEDSQDVPVISLTVIDRMLAFWHTFLFMYSDNSVSSLWCFAPLGTAFSVSTIVAITFLTNTSNKGVSLVLLVSLGLLVAALSLLISVWLFSKKEAPANLLIKTSSLLSRYKESYFKEYAKNYFSNKKVILVQDCILLEIALKKLSEKKIRLDVERNLLKIANQG